jgi:hypothetical protein
MTVPDTSAVDEALVTVLSNDATLKGLLPDGVAFDLAPQGWTQFVIVTMLAHLDTYSQAGEPSPASTIETCTYLVKAVSKGTSGLTAKQAAARIHVLLQGGTLTIDGYDLMLMERTERIRYTELDEVTQDRWNHRGGHYDIWVTPQAAGVRAA